MTLRNRLAGKLANSSTPPSLLVVSDNHVGSTLAADLAGKTDLALATDRPEVGSRAPDGVQTTVGDLSETETLDVGADADVAVVALRQDRRTLLVAQLLRTQFDIDSLVVVLNDPERHGALDDIATDVVCRSTCLSAELSDTIEQTLPDRTSSHS